MTFQTSTRLINVAKLAPLSDGMATALRNYWPKVAGALNYQLRETARLLGLAEPTPAMALGFLWAGIDAGVVDGKDWDAYCAEVRWASL